MRFINRIHRSYKEHQNSLKSRVTFATLCIFLAGIWIISLYSFYSLRVDLETALGGQQRSAATIIARQIGQSINYRIAGLEHAARLVSPSLLDNAEAAQEFLDNRYDLQQLFEKGYFLTKTDAISVAFSPSQDSAVGTDYSDRDYVTAALRGAPATSIPIIGKVTRIPIIGIAVPIRLNSKVIGVMAGVLDLTTGFLGDIAYSSYGKTGDFVIIDRQSRLIIAASNTSQVMTMLSESGSNNDIDDLISGNKFTATFVNSAGIEVVASAVTIPSADWVMIISMPTSELYAPSYLLQQHILMLALLLSIVVVIVTWIVLTIQLRPLARVVDALSSMSGNKLHPLPHINGGTEIEHVVTAFNSLLFEVTDRDNKLKASTQQYDTLVSRIPIGVYILRTTVGGQYSFDYVSPKFASMFRLPVDEMTQRPEYIFSIVHPDDHAGFVAANSRSQLELETFEWEGRIVIDGDTRWMRFYSVPNLLPSGDSIWHGILSDVTERRLVENELTVNVERLNDAQSYAHIGWWELDADGIHAIWSPEIYRILGVDPSTPAGPETLIKVIHDTDALPTTISINACLTAGVEHQVEYRITRATDGAERWIDCRARPVRNSTGKIVKISGFIQDITDRKILEEQVSALANHDPLSGLPNRRMLSDRLSYVLAMSRRTKHYGALMFVDLDKFKSINDSYGHVAGDQLIIEAASRIQSCVRETDTVSRFGGDEFVVLLNDLSADRAAAAKQAMLLAEDIRTSLSQPYQLLGGTAQFRCTASVGIALFMNGQSTEATIISQADTAMYRAKENGRDQILMFNPPHLEAPPQIT